MDMIPLKGESLTEKSGKVTKRAHYDLCRLSETVHIHKDAPSEE